MLGCCRRSNEFFVMSLPTRSSSTYRPTPWTIDTMAMRNITPMATPMSVKKLLSFCTRI
jgi:hypothetical protein